MFLKKCFLVFCIVSLSACAGPRIENGKINPKYNEGVPIQTKLMNIYPEKPLHVHVPVTNAQVHGGGLIGALLITAVNVTSTVVSHEKRREKTAEILDSVNPNIYYTALKTYTPSIKKAKWLKIHDVVEYKNLDTDGLKEVGEEFRNNLDGKAQGVLGAQYIIGENYESLTQHVRFQIKSVENGKAKDDIYTLLLSDTFYPETSMDTGLDQYSIWIDNGNALIKKAIKETTKNINKQLIKTLKDPFIEEENEETKK